MSAAKKFLSQAFHIDQRINSKLEQVLSLRSLAEKATTTLSKTPPSSSRDTQPMETVIVKMMDMETAIDADLGRLVDLKHEIVSVLSRIEDSDLQAILELRYLCYMTWKDIAATLTVHISWVHRLHAKALAEVDCLIGRK
jgi:DNA-directed RNA polymerase specialized sigma subunit